MPSGDAVSLENLLIFILALVALGLLFAYRIYNARPGPSRRPYDQQLKSRQSDPYAVWSAIVPAHFPIIQFLDCVKTELGWSAATFLPEDPCHEVFNGNDGYGYGADDLILELKQQFHASVTIQEIAHLFETKAPFHEFVKLIVQRYQ